MKLFLILCIFATHLCHAETITSTYHFSPAPLGGYELTRIYENNRFPLSIEPGKPVLPFRASRILLPPGSRIVSVAAQRSGIREIGHAGMIPVAGRITPFSLRSEQSVTRKSAADLSFEKPYPESINPISLQRLHGYRILLSNIHPVFITPDKRVYFSERITITVKTADTGSHTQVIDPMRAPEIMSIVENRAMLDAYSHLAKTESPDAYDYLIITSDTLLKYKGDNSLFTFKTFLENTRNLGVKIVSTQTATTAFPGKDPAESVRNFIREEYKNNGIRYVLLAADSDGNNPQLPVRKLYSKVRGYLNGQWTDVKAQIASDFYYSCLDGSFNDDGDANWGETHDGPDGGDVDFLCEVTVGRWPVDNAEELRPIVKKSIQAYGIKQRAKNALLLGELLFRELNLWGADYMNQLIGEVTDHGYTTRGFDSAWHIDTLYDKDKKWSGTTARQKIEGGDYLVVNHLGHSSQYSNMRLWSWSYGGFKNTNPYFYYSQGCYAGDFTTDATIVEKMMFKPGGPFAAVANSHYGLGPEDPAPNTTKTPGTSQILNRFFINRAMGSHYLSFGEAHQKSKEDILIYIQHQEARWVTWAATYFGDPALRP